MSRFLILAAPRTGSNLLCSLLDSHPEILCHHELFNPEGIFTSLTMRGQADPLGSLGERDCDPLAFLDRVWHASQDCGFPCVGFKWTRGQNEVVMRRVLADANVKKLVLHRRNRVKTYVSERIAQHTQQWEVYDAKQLVSAPRINVDEADLRQHIQNNGAFYADLERSLNQLSQPYIQVTYESLFTADEQRRILSFLGVTGVDRELLAVSVKQNSTDLRESINNFSKLAISLARCGLDAELCERDT